MSKTKFHTYRIDGDAISVRLTFDAERKRWVGEHPFFAEEPRYTPNGRPWCNVFRDECPYSDPVQSDCGGCRFYRRQRVADVIGVCFHPKRQQSER